MLATELNGRLPIIGVGGIDSVIAAREKLAAGATLVQIYSGFIFKGPPLIKEIVTHLIFSPSESSPGLYFRPGCFIFLHCCLFRHFSLFLILEIIL